MSHPVPRTDVDIVGVVADASIGSIREPHQAVVFRPMMPELTRAQFPLAHVRVSGDLKAVRDAYVRVVESHGHHFVRGLFTLDEWIDFALLQERLIAALSTSAAALAVVQSEPRAVAPDDERRAAGSNEGGPTLSAIAETE